MTMPQNEDRDDRDREDDIEADRRDRRRYDPDPPQRSSNKPLFLILGGIGCVILVCCGGLTGIGIWGFNAFKTQLEPAIGTSNQFLDLLQQKQVDQAYALTSSGYRARTTEAQFAEFLKKFEMFGQATSHSMTSANVFKNQSGSRVVVKMTLNSPNNAMSCTLTLVKEQENWKVDGLAVP
jgi:hypothetical protein